MANLYSTNLVAASSQWLNNVSTTFLADAQTDATVEVWFKTATQPAEDTNVPVISFITSPNGTAGYFCYLRYYDVSGTNSLQASFQGTSGGNAVIETGTLDLDTWYHVAIVKDDTVISMYLNGEAVVDTGVQGTAGDWSTALGVKIGADRSASPSRFWNGKIDEVRIWSDVRTEAEIQDNMSTELVGNEAGLEGYWQLNNDLEDATANNRDLTNNNTATFSSDTPFGPNKTVSVADVISMSIPTVVSTGNYIRTFVSNLSLSSATTQFRGLIGVFVSTLILQGVRTVTTLWSWLAEHSATWTSGTKNTTDSTYQTKNETDQTYQDKS